MVALRGGPVQGQFLILKNLQHSAKHERRLSDSSLSLAPSQGRPVLVPATEPTTSTSKKRKAEDTILSPDSEPPLAGSKPPPLFTNEVSNVLDLAKRLRPPHG